MDNSAPHGVTHAFRHPSDYLTLAVSPFERPDHRLVSAFARAGALAFVDVGHDPDRARDAIHKVRRTTSEPFGVRLPDGVSAAKAMPTDPDGRIVAVMHASPDAFDPIPDVYNLVQVVSVEEVARAQSAGADALIVKGAESGGRVGEHNTFILLQHLMDRIRVPFWVQGGMGPHGAAAAVLAGARGVVYDSQLALLDAADTADDLRAILAGVNGSETALAGGYRFLRHKLLPDLDDDADRLQVLTEMKGPNPPVPAGEDMALAPLFQALYKDPESLVYATEQSVQGHLRTARREPVFHEDSPFAREYGLNFPILQGPMTRVSDVPGFAGAVADGGALPSIALAVLKPDQARPMLEQTRDRLADRPWSVGLLGFLPAERYREQVALVRDMGPSHVIIAGGRPDQARAFEDAGIGAFLHCPSMRLFDRFLKDGARRFIFEGRECGGHVGPLSSMTLWEGQISLALESEQLADLSLVFSGGLHDQRSAALLSAMCAPLAALGAKIGLLMGTAYLFTEEAVREGAILEEYQRQALDGDDTALIQTGPGHVTRCLRTPYVDFLNTERARLLALGMDRDEIFMTLEGLNVGHLRIASKGRKRIDDRLETVDAETQRQEGMYMIGDVATLRDRVTTIEALHRDIMAADTWLRARPEALALGRDRSTSSCDIAIVGMAGIFPGALTAEEYWANIIEGVDAVTEVPDSRWDKATYYDPSAMGAKGDKTNSKWGGFIPDFQFDPGRFGIPPQTLGSIDPAQIASLEVAYRALQDADYLDRNFNRERTACIFGVEPGGDLFGAYGMRIVLPQLLEGDTLAQAQAAFPSLTEDSFPGVLGNVVTGRISNRLDFGGQNFTIDAACASSLAAIDAAIKELRYGESDMAIAGGVDFHNGIHDYLMFSSTHALSSRGRCFTFSETADGITLGEGAAAVVLKRYEDALCDGDRVYAVIRGIGGASDGKSLGLTAPRKQGQQRALNRAYRRASVSPAQIGLLEAHGTGTVVGDRTEMASLETVFSSAGSDRAACALGSVKTQIGHTKCTSGVASLIKAAYAVDQGLLPPTLNIEKPNAYYDKDRSSFYFLKHTQPWFDADRKAGVSAFGFGGTNYHTVIDRGDADGETPTAPTVWPYELFVFRGDTEADALAGVTALQAFLAVGRQCRLADVAYSHHRTGEGAGPVRIALVAHTLADLAAKLDTAANGREDPRGVWRAKSDAPAGEVAFLFPGQGSQFLNMGADLFTYFPHLRALLADEPGLRAALFPKAAFDEAEKAAQNDALTDTRTAQPALGLVSLAVARVLADLGVKASQLAGHSYGELSALSHAGSIDPADLTRISRQRADCIRHSLGDGDNGAMLAVEADEDWVRAHLPDTLDLANLNAPTQTVVSGPTADIDAFKTLCEHHSVGARRLPVACAFHSRALGGAADAFTQALQLSTDLGAPGLAVWSNETAEPYPADIDGRALAERLGQQIRSSVRFVDTVRGLYEQAGVRTFVEVGAGSVLGGLTQSILADRPDVQCLPTLLKDAPPLKALMSTLARLAVSGVELDTAALYAHRRLRRLDIADPQPLAQTTWLVNGQRAWPLNGRLPAHAFDPDRQTAIDLRNRTVPAPVPGGDRDTAIKAYFDSLDRFIDSQRDVMLGYLGTAPTAPALAEPSMAAPAPAIESGAAEPADTVTPATAPVQAVDRDTIEARLRALICDRTGYPDEMLDPELDLEADLGIDSIKRVELLSEIGESLGLNTAHSTGELGEEATRFLEEVSRIKTLRGVSDWLAEFSRKAAATVDLAAEPSPAASSEPAQKALTRADIETRLVTLICERTGYPAEMLDPELDLEADLGIDSIKRVELLSDIGDQIGLNTGRSTQELGEEASAFLEEVSRIKTLRGISEWLAKAANAEATPEQEQAPEAQETGDSAVADDTDHRAAPFKVLNVLYHARDLAPDAEADLDGKTFHVVGANRVELKALDRVFRPKGVSISTLDPDSLDEADTLDTRGLLYFSHDDGHYDNLATLFRLLRACDPHKMDTVMVIQKDNEALLTESGHYQGPCSGSGLSGFLVSLHWEWPRARMIRSLINHDAKTLSEDELAERIREEVFSQAETLAQPVAYHQGRRYVRKALPRGEIQPVPNVLELDRDSTVVFVGGAKGITSWFAAAFAERFGCRLVIIGRSPRPEQNDPWPELTTAAELRKALLADEPGAKPRDIERRVQALLADKQMRANLQALEAGGSEVLYLSADITDAAQVDAALQETVERCGGIDGVLLGAGILDDRFLKDKQADSIERVYNTKVAGVDNVLASLERWGEPRFCVFFSSLSATLGNRGQTDYSAANNYLDMRALQLNAERDGHYLSVNWGPWEGAGMIDATLQKHLEGMGVGAIRREEGVDFLIDELSRGKGAGRLIAMCAADDALHWTE
ncbi:type I polyketide synthase [Saccharospirillum salsuginis]|nr:type I polyketide synthase [Saccharospirillum salsuginis]